VSIDNAGYFTSVSCASTLFCVALDSNGSALTYNGSSWSAPVNINNSTSLYSVSCPSVSFCVAVASGGGAVTYNGSSWSAPIHIDAVGTLNAVSCPSASFCAAADWNGHALTYNGSSWSAPVLIAEGIMEGYTYGLTSVSCASASLCVVGDGNGGVLDYNGSSWTGAGFGGIVVSVSCPSTSFCVAVDYTGDALIYNGSSWSTPTRIEEGEGLGETFGLRSVSCGSASFCVAVDSNGNALTYNSGSWSAPIHIDAFGALEAVSCPSASFCAVVDNKGNVVTYSGSPPAISPKNVSLPTISGSARVWQTLSCAQGSWTGNLPLTFAYQWRRDGAAISGATGSTYVVEEADAGHTLTCEVIATNGVGSTHVTSTGVSVPARKPPASSSCPDVVIYGARGSGEDNTAANVGMGPVPYQVGQEIVNRLPVGHRVEMIGVNYPAVPATALVNYEWSVVTGTEVLVEGDNGHGGLVSLVLKCPKVAVVLVGLSQGAHVIHYTLSLAPPHPSAVTRRIAASLLFGDPVRQPNQSYNVTNQAAKGVLLGFTPLPGNSGPPNIVSSLQPATQSYCLPYDPICDSTGALEPGGFVIYRTIHDGYGSSPYIADAASFAVNRINEMLGHTATAAARTGVAATAARASKAHRKRAGHRCNRRQADPFDATSVCPHVTHGVRPQRQSTYKGSSRDRDAITMTASRNAANVSVKVVDRCGTVFSGTIAVTRGGVFDGTTPEGFEITGLFANKRLVRGTLTDPSCKSLPIRSFTLRRRGH
jgi:Cutinase